MKKYFLSVILVTAYSSLLFAQPSGSLFKVNAYLQNPQPDGITVMWQTLSPCYSWVEYGTDTLNLQTARTVVDGLVVSDNTKNKIRIDGLQADTKYFYRICSREILLFEPYKKEFGRTEKSPFYTFTTFGATKSDFTCLIFNDIHNKLPLFDALMAQVKDVNYDFVLFNGDCFTDLKSEGDAVQILAHYNEKTDAANRPAFYLRGNHETRGAFALGLPSLFDCKAYFAYTFGDTRFVMLDCGEDKPDSTWVYYGLNDFESFRQQETQWLKSELTTKEFKNAKTRILVHHIPIYGSDDKYNPCLELWNPILQEAPFAIGIHAHTHQDAYHAKGDVGNPFPVIIGGGNNEKSARVIVLEKKNGKLYFRVIDTSGKSVNYTL